MALAVEKLALMRGGRLLLRDLSFALEPGQALLLEGPNGSGKSSLLRLLAGFLPPASGALLWQGAGVIGEPDDYRAGLRYIGHQDAVKPQIRAVDTLCFWGRLLGLNAAEARSRAEAALQAAGLGNRAEFLGRYLSAGQKRRLGLARLLLQPAALWLLDEPTNALDADAIQWFGQCLGEHRAAGGIAVIASHVPLPVENALRLRLPEGKLA